MSPNKISHFLELNQGDSFLTSHIIFSVKMEANKTSLRTVTNQVTKEKLAWLDNQRKSLNTVFAPILEKFEKPENKASLEFLKEIHATLKKCSDVDNPIPNKTKDLSVFMNWIQLEDPRGMIYFGSEHLVRHWIEMLIRNIRFQIEKCEYSCLYANVMSQYMDANSSESEDTEIDGKGVEVGGSDEGSNKRKTMEEFSARIFQVPKDFDVKKYEEFLHTLFDNGDDSKSLRLLQETRRQVKIFCKNFTNMDAGKEDLKLVIDGLIAEDLLGAEKAFTLRELRENEDALGEVSTLLKSRIDKYKDWKWPGAIQVDFRRNIAGRYRAYMDEDIITALFLHFVGAQWSIFLKQEFKKILASKMWIRGTDTVGDLYYKKHSIEGHRRELHDVTFLSILPSEMRSLSATAGVYETGVRYVNKAELTPTNIKQTLLHLISTEIHLNNVLRPGKDLTVVQTDMEWFGPSLAHEAIMTVMKFIGVTDEWLGFFRTFLETPIKVGSATAAVQIRKNGVPISHSLSTLFGESLLFIMDLYVNQRSGLSVFRIHDDFWFWHHNLEKVKQAWEAMKTYTQLAGLKLNFEKSASVVCNSTSSPTDINPGPEGLPQMKVKWGFIVLHSDGVYRIDQDLLEPHVKEMTNCLAKSETVMNWINVHNKYLRFIIRNCAEPARTLGKQHIVQILEALQKILTQVHPETAGDIVKALKNKFPQVWGDKPVMDSWFHWSVEQGGLSLYNPFLDLIPLHEAYRKHDEEKALSGHTSGVFGEVIDKDKEEWRKLLEESKKRRKRRSQYTDEDVDEDTITDKDEDEDEEGGHQKFKKYGAVHNFAKLGAPPAPTFAYAECASFGSVAGGGGNLDEEAEEEEEEIEPESSGSCKKENKEKKNKGKKRVGCEAWMERYRETRWNRWRSAYSIQSSNLSPIYSNDCGGDWRKYLYAGQMEEKLGRSDSFVDPNLVPLSLIMAMQGSKVHKN